MWKAIDAHIITNVCITDTQLLSPKLDSGMRTVGHKGCEVLSLPTHKSNLARQDSNTQPNSPEAGTPARYALHSATAASAGDLNTYMCERRMAPKQF